MIPAPLGAPASRDQESVFAGRSASVAVTVKLSGANSWTVRLPGLTTSGGSLPSLTVTVIVSKSLRVGLPLSVTRTVMGKLPGPCASVGVHANAPVAPLIVAPAGAPASRVKVIALPSGSFAVAVNVSARSSLTVRSPIASSTGARLGAALTERERLEVVHGWRSVVGHADGDKLAARVSVGVQVKAPVEGSIVAPVGAPGSTEKLSVLAGRSRRSPSR